jgi:uncharacterized membrane protein YidH (DUF202 family)
MGHGGVAKRSSCVNADAENRAAAEAVAMINVRVIELLSRPLGRFEGFAFMFGGVAIVVLATTRFVRTTRLLHDAETYSGSNVRAELISSAALVVLATIYSICLAFD